MESVDNDGWLMTGDIGFFDDDENIYVKERTSFMFKYFMFIVSEQNNFCSHKIVVTEEKRQEIESKLILMRNISVLLSYIG
jgi:acyl-CoA synthetase (AMP-forming)/AMP-acid ligase II